MFWLWPSRKWGKRIQSNRFVCNPCVQQLLNCFPGTPAELVDDLLTGDIAQSLDADNREQERRDKEREEDDMAFILGSDEE